MIEEGRRNKSSIVNDGRLYIKRINKTNNNEKGRR